MQSQIPTAKAIHDAVAGGDLAEAERLLEPYRAEVVAAWQSAESESERNEIVADVNGLLEWARITTLSSRTHAQNKLLLLSRDNAYSGAARRVQAFSLEA